ncbi:MAG: histidine phosphatase family protein [Actinomycetaceae bacterium]|nr:histidine phosphatase family protein [Actinomycetaceae bacterium]
MSARRVVLWRHGQTDLNISFRIQGSLDIPLNDAGREQASAAAEHIARLEPTAIVSSPLSRAHETARALAEVTGLDVAKDERLAERDFGQWEGLDREAIAGRWPEQFNAWSSGLQPQGVGVETKTAVGERVSRAVAHWAGQTDGTLVVVAHGSALMCGVIALLGMDPAQWDGFRGMDNCHWSIVLPQPERNPRWRVYAYNRGVDD